MEKNQQGNYVSRLLDTIKKVKKEYGRKGLTKEVLSYVYRRGIRPITPTIGYKKHGKSIIFDGIKIGQKEKLFDRYVPYLDRSVVNSDVEMGLRLGHIALTRMGDHVVIIGGGNGLRYIQTKIQSAANSSKRSSRVRCYGV
jgi:hypothetical protein